MKILLVEDEPKVAQFIKKGLEEQSYEVEVAYDGFLGRRMALDRPYDLIVLDVNLPQVNGYEVCRAIRQHDAKVPVLMLTAFGTMDDKVMGFDVGADDYLVKPFEFRELLVRARALYKRTQYTPRDTNVLRVADLELNLEEKTVRRGDTSIQLTAREFALLEYLLRNRNRVVSRIDIAERVWDVSFDTGTNVIEVYVNFLRKKIDRDFSPKLIHTVVGMGYVLRAS
ncbi:DNA-binding response regulator, OmpR family, contains REC and winged-helix (wHTH) domain [Catalinimonas alkaloidigena]|uniref:DNA-binding response regulator, OmpR family, contains REC and winged-helix (WHTH) domain n=1 Tax=Catalinimonas alkaloidigena TaxID=1075417 RepID=A0A1G9HWY2_9BACT|nr:response regulator transcription factor [Catalinimonas alkaloidigena]SDL17335.1 DNA-binding response regulator, OmpR family, contains REC and winged-helix (wHTH) domain [Catalinimonas alkaloidigena]